MAKNDKYFLVTRIFHFLRRSPSSVFDRPTLLPLSFPRSPFLSLPQSEKKCRSTFRWAAPARPCRSAASPPVAAAAPSALRCLARRSPLAAAAWRHRSAWWCKSAARPSRRSSSAASTATRRSPPTRKVGLDARGNAATSLMLQWNIPVQREKGRGGLGTSGRRLLVLVTGSRGLGGSHTIKQSRANMPRNPCALVLPVFLPHPACFFIR